MEFPLFLLSKLNLSEKSVKELAGAIRYEELPKGHYLFRKGEICRRIFYIETGMARAYYTSSRGKEITAWFAADNNFITALDSFFGDKPAHTNGELLEPSVVFSIEYLQLEALLETNTDTAKVAFRIAMEILKRHTEHLTNIKFQSAKERFDSLMNDYPSIFLRVPLGHIASYLGITQETLSRMRAKKQERPS